MWVSGVESTQLLTTDKPKVCFWGGPVSVLGDPLRPLWQWLYMPASINFVVGVSQGRCQGGQGYIQTMVYSIHNIRALWRTCLNTRSCGCFLRGYPPFLTHLAVYYTHISPGVCKNSGCLIPRHRFWRMLTSEKVNRLTVFHHASCLGKKCHLKHLRWKLQENTVQLEDDPFHFFFSC